MAPAAAAPAQPAKPAAAAKPAQPAKPAKAAGSAPPAAAAQPTGAAAAPKKDPALGNKATEGAKQNGSTPHANGVPAGKSDGAAKPADGAPSAPATSTAASSAPAANTVVFDFYKPPVNGRNVKPVEAERTAALGKIEEAINAAKAQREDAMRQLNAAKEAGREGQEDRARVRGVQNKIREELTSARGARDILLLKEKDCKQKVDNLRLEERKMRESVKFTSPEAIDAEVQRLEFRQQTEHLSLKDEKILIQQIEKVRASKKLIGALVAKQAEAAQAEEERKLATAEANKQRAVVDRLQARFDEVKKELDALAPPPSNPAEQRARFEAASKRVDELYAQKQLVFKAWKDANEKFFQAEQERRRLVDEKRKAEQEAYEKEREAKRLAQEKEREALELAESLKKPWTEEIGYCTFLLQYLHKLQGTPFTDFVAEQQQQQHQPSGSAAAAAGLLGQAKPKREVKAAPELKLLVKKEDEYFPAKPAAAAKAKPQASAAAANGAPVNKGPKLFSHTTDVISTFARVGIDPPTGSAQLEAKIEEVRAKRSYYDTLPRPPKQQAQPKPESTTAATEPAEPSKGGKANGNATSAAAAAASSSAAAAAPTADGGEENENVAKPVEVFPQLRQAKVREAAWPNVQKQQAAVPAASAAISNADHETEAEIAPAAAVSEKPKVVPPPGL